MLPHPRLLLILLLVPLLLAPATPAAAQTGERCFSETGFCISGRIREFWEQNGGLPVFGLPITPQQQETIEGQSLQVQWFERNRLELHPENQRPYDVLLGRLGADRLQQQGRDPFLFPKDPPQGDCITFETGHSVCGAILAAWQASGLEFDGRPGASFDESLALFGLPLSSPKPELIEGREYTVQWFERARFELHPENAPPFNVLLGLLGNEVRGGNQAQPIAPPAPQPSPSPAPPAPQPGGGGGDCPTPPSNSAPNNPIAIVGLDKDGETVTIRNVTGKAVDVSGWRVCSVRGNQLHAVLSGQLAGGQTQEIARQAGTTIWSNSEQDDAALYDAAGALIAYWVDR
jgi:hypothetical protein